MMEFREEVGRGVQAVNTLIADYQGIEFSMDTPEGQTLNGHIRQLSGILAGSVECIFVIQPHGSTAVGEITVPVSQVHELLHSSAS